MGENDDSPEPVVVAILMVSTTVLLAAFLGTALPEETIPQGTVVLTDNGEASPDDLNTNFGPPVYTYESLDPQMQSQVDRALALDGPVRTTQDVAYDYALPFETPMNYGYFVVTKGDTAHRIGATIQYENDAYNFLMHHPFLVAIVGALGPAIPLFIVRRFTRDTNGQDMD